MNGNGFVHFVLPQEQFQLKDFQKEVLLRVCREIETVALVIMKPKQTISICSSFFTHYVEIDDSSLTNDFNYYIFCEEDH